MQIQPKTRHAFLRRLARRTGMAIPLTAILAIHWPARADIPRSNESPADVFGSAHVDGNNYLTNGAPTMAWHRYRRLLVTSDAGAATTRAIKSRLTEAFHEDFARPDGNDLGTGWTQAAHYGVVNKQIAHHRLHFEIPDGKDIPWGSATLDLGNPAILGHGLRVGDYFEITLRRLSAQGSPGVELFDSDQLRVGGDHSAGASPLKAWNGVTWVPISFDDHGQPVAFDWNKSHVLGVRFDSADGSRTTFSYYLDGQYAGSWLINTANRTLDKIGVYVQSTTPGAVFEFDGLKVYDK